VFGSIATCKAFPGLAGRLHISDGVGRRWVTDDDKVARKGVSSEETFEDNFRL
jgi:hypothetical protein